jgi:hypothetical protein
VCALRAIVGVYFGISGCLLRGCVELREEDLGAGAEVEADGEGVDCAKGQAGGGGKEDAAVGWGYGEEDRDAGGHCCSDAVRLVLGPTHFDSRQAV